MTKPNLIAQSYGYAVCLVAVVTFLISTTSLITNSIDRQDPLHSGSCWYGATQPSLASFENYKMDVLKSSKGDGDASKASYIPDDKTLHEMFESAKSEKARSAMHTINRNIASDCILIFICVLLFVIHWRWLRKMAVGE